MEAVSKWEEKLSMGIISCDSNWYSSLSLDYLNGWIYPLTPRTIIRKRNNVFLEESVQLGR